VSDYETGRYADVPERQLDAVSSLADLAAVVTRMREDLLATGAEEWENRDLARFLDGLAAVAEDWPLEKEPTWAVFASLRVAATGYE
jgi:hypothetical protein